MRSTLFFLISGFLLFDGKRIEKGRLLRNIKHILHINIWATLLFVIWTEIMFAKNGFFMPSAMQWLEFIFLNENPFGFHLWYLGAYLYVLIIMYFIEKHYLYNYFFYITPLLLLGDLVLGKYSLLLFNREIPYIYVRNFLFVGIPYFFIGILIKKYYHKIIGFNRLILMGGGILFTVTSFLERQYLMSIDKNPMRDHYISTTFLAICLMISFLLHRVKKRTLFSSIGEKDTLYIYILHPIVINIIFALISSLQNQFAIIYKYTAPAIVLATTLALIKFIRKIKIIND